MPKHIHTPASCIFPYISAPLPCPIQGTLDHDMVQGCCCAIHGTIAACRDNIEIYIYIQYIDIYMEIFAYINVGIHFNKVSCKLCLLYECWNAEYQALHSICNIHTVHIKHYSRIYKICGTNQPFWKPHQRGGATRSDPYRFCFVGLDQDREQCLGQSAQPLIGGTSLFLNVLCSWGLGETNCICHQTGDTTGSSRETHYLRLGAWISLS